MARPFGTFKYRTADELEKAIDEYFDICDGKPLRDEDGSIVFDKHGNPKYTTVPEPYTIEGLALYLDVTPQTISNYAKNEDYFDTINRARMKCLAYLSKRTLDKDGVQGARFLLTNNSERMGGLKYAERQEMSIDGNLVCFNGADQLED